MIKMIIKMDEGKIRTSDKYTIDQVYQALDRVFLIKEWIEQTLIAVLSMVVMIVQQTLLILAR